MHVSHARSLRNRKTFLGMAQISSSLHPHPKKKKKKKYFIFKGGGGGVNQSLLLSKIIIKDEKV